MVMEWCVSIFIHVSNLGSKLPSHLHEQKSSIMEFVM